jgi:hypothetical protein
MTIHIKMPIKERVKKLRRRIDGITPGTVFATLLFLRFLYPFYMHPMRKIGNDWQRHLDNGVFFMDMPTLMGGIDSKLYQLWLYLLNHIAGGNAYLVAAGTGLLAAAMPYVWYRAAREAFSHDTALKLGIVIALCPSFIPIYSFFMSETLLLVTFGLAIWMTLRAARLQSFAAFNMAALCWVLALHSRMVVLPAALLAMVWLLHYQKDKMRAVRSALALLLVITLPAAVQSYRSLYVFVPFQFTTLNEIYYKSGTMTHTYDILGSPFGGRLSWTSPSFFDDPLAPLSKYKSYRMPGSHHSVIDIRHGSRDWDKALKEVESGYTWEMFFSNIYENAVFLFFGYSWPDSYKNASHYLSYINYHLRWVWAALLIYMLAAVPVTRTDEKKAFLLLAAWLMAVSLLVQWMGVMEGRYRKPLEPLLMIGAVILWTAHRKKAVGTPASETFSPYQFVMMCAVRPCLHQVKETAARLAICVKEFIRSAPPDRYPW